jgi:hypothetical protein
LPWECDSRIRTSQGVVTAGHERHWVGFLERAPQLPVALQGRDRENGNPAQPRLCRLVIALDSEAGHIAG